MAFWGAEVKPAEAYIHRYNSVQGRLHLSQATLGDGKSTKKCILQCTVGSQKPIYLCSLLPDKLETCALNLEFEEVEKVTLSVIGSHSVHLSGYFIGDYGDEDDNDSDSDQFEGHGCGSDCESDESMDYIVEDDDEFDDDDFDDNMYVSSPVHPSGVKIEEIVDDEDPVKDSGMLKPTKKKKHQTNESNGGKNAEKQIIVESSSQIPVVVESEDEDGFPITSAGKRKTGTSNNNKVNDNKVEDVPGKKDTVDNGQANSENGSKLGKRKKNKKVLDAEENIPEKYDENSSLQEANHGKAEQTVEKKKPKEKKKKNKKLKSENAPETTTGKSMSTVDSETKNDDEPSQVRTFPNGLVIEEMAMGRPDGKKAAPGKKVSVHYVGKLKKSGKIFDSNIGRAPLKFRLGIGQVIKGWDVGVNGMRVGDKRRLTVPPSMGYGDKGVGAIPPNAWLVFDVELVDVM